MSTYPSVEPYPGLLDRLKDETRVRVRPIPRGVKLHRNRRGREWEVREEGGERRSVPRDDCRGRDRDQVQMQGPEQVAQEEEAKALDVFKTGVERGRSDSDDLLSAPRRDQSDHKCSSPLSSQDYGSASVRQSHLPTKSGDTFEDMALLKEECTRLKKSEQSLLSRIRILEDELRSCKMYHQPLENHLHT